LTTGSFLGSNWTVARAVNNDQNEINRNLVLKDNAFSPFTQKLLRGSQYKAKVMNGSEKIEIELMTEQEGTELANDQLKWTLIAVTIKENTLIWIIANFDD
jgi:hypothetical protein